MPPEADNRQDSTMRALIAALRETLRLFWNAPGETVAMTWWSVLGEKNESRRWYEKAKARADRG